MKRLFPLLWWSLLIIVVMAIMIVVMITAMTNMVMKVRMTKKRLVLYWFELLQ